MQFDTWTDEAGQVHMSLGFTVYGLAKTPRNVLREAGNSMLYYGRIILPPSRTCSAGGRASTIFPGRWAS